jgi:hypothetical protein
MTLTLGPRPTRGYKHDKEKHRVKRLMVSALNQIAAGGDTVEARREAELACVIALETWGCTYHRFCRRCGRSFYSLNPRARFCRPAHKAAFNRAKAKKAQR